MSHYSYSVSGRQAGTCDFGAAKLNWFPSSPEKGGSSWLLLGMKSSWHAFTSKNLSITEIFHKYALGVKHIRHIYLLRGGEAITEYFLVKDIIAIREAHQNRHQHQ